MIVKDMEDHIVKFATAQTYIGLPFMDFNPLKLFLEVSEKTLKQDTKSQYLYVPDKKCEDTQLRPIIFNIAGLAFRLVVAQYTKDNDMGCQVLFKVQDEDFDDVGYNLGLPFITAFNVILDYENNRIGFAEKYDSFVQGYSIEEYRPPLPLDTPKDKENRARDFYNELEMIDISEIQMTEELDDDDDNN